MQAVPPWNPRDALNLALIAGVVGALALAPASDVDLFWHLAVGRFISETGAPPTTNLWSFTAPDHPFSATAWLFDWGAFWLQSHWGLAAVQGACALLLAATFGLVYATARRLGSTPAWALALTLASAAAAQTRFTQRPHVVTYLCLSALLLLVARLRAGGGIRALVFGPVLVAVWSNFHAGAAFGAGVLGLCAIGAWVDRFRSVPVAPTAPSAWQWTAVAAAASLALAANPNGAHEISYALFHLGTVNEVVTLGEFGSPGLSTHGAFWVLLGLGLLTQAVRWRHRDVTHLLLLVAFAILAARAMYVAPMFLIVAAPLTAAGLTEITGPLNRRLSPLARIAIGGFAPLLGLVAALSGAPEPLEHFARRIQPGPDPFLVPQRGAARVKELGISGRCFASWDLNGFVEWMLPDSPVYLDPRLLAYPPEVFQRLSKAEETQQDFDALIDDARVEWAFRSHRLLRMSGVGRFPPERWALIYWDEASMIFVRRAVERFGPLIRDHELRFFTPASSPLESWKTLAGADRAAWLREVDEEALAAPQLANARLAQCLEAERAGDHAGAEAFCHQAEVAALERQRFHPLEGVARRAEISIALAIIGRRNPRFLDRAETLAPESPEALTAVGAGWLATDPRRALGLFNRALALNGLLPAAREGRERALRALGKSD